VDFKPYSNPDVESSVVAIRGDLQDTFKSLSRELKERLAELDRNKDLVDGSKLNIERIRNLCQQLQKVADENGFRAAIDNQSNQIVKLAESILSESGRSGLATKFAGGTSDGIEAMMWGVHREIIGSEVKVAGDLERLLLRSVMGGTRWGDLIDSMQKTLDINEEQAITKASTTLANFHTLVRRRHFEENGIEWFEYAGPEDDINRPFCAHFAGTRVTAAILDANADEFKRNDPLPPSISLGGYNCRHELIPLVDGKDSDLPVGPQ